MSKEVKCPSCEDLWKPEDFITLYKKEITEKKKIIYREAIYLCPACIQSLETYHPFIRLKLKLLHGRQ